VWQCSVSQHLKQRRSCFSDQHSIVQNFIGGLYLFVFLYQDAFTSVFPSWPFISGITVLSVFGILVINASLRSDTSCLILHTSAVSWKGPCYLWGDLGFLRCRPHSSKLPADSRCITPYRHLSVVICSEVMSFNLPYKRHSNVVYYSPFLVVCFCSVAVIFWH
jgi:hypothetical protein